MAEWSAAAGPGGQPNFPGCVSYFNSGMPRAGKALAIGAVSRRPAFELYLDWPRANPRIAHYTAAITPLIR
jgi:hypothetical protein